MVVCRRGIGSVAEVVAEERAVAFVPETRVHGKARSQPVVGHSRAVMPVCFLKLAVGRTCVIYRHRHVNDICRDAFIETGTVIKGYWLMFLERDAFPQQLHQPCISASFD